MKPGSSSKIQQLTTSWYPISLTVRTYACVAQWGFPLLAARMWSRNSLRAPAVCQTINWWLCPTTCIYIHLTACCCWFLLLPVLRRIFNFGSWVIYLVASSAASWWTIRCLHSCCVPMSEIIHESPTNRHDFDPLAAGCGGCVSLTSWCGIGEEDDNEEKWEVLRTI